MVVEIPGQSSTDLTLDGEPGLACNTDQTRAISGAETSTAPERLPGPGYSMTCHFQQAPYAATGRVDTQEETLLYL
jgi:hypothetical protein